jgi:hypothetical protein
MSLLSIQTITLDNWNFSESSPKLRARPSREFIARNNAGNAVVVGGPNFYLEWNLTTGTRSSGGDTIPTVTIPNIDIYSTRDAIGFTGAYWIFEFYDSRGNKLGSYDGFTRVTLPGAFASGSLTPSWSDVYTFNHPMSPILVDRSTLSREQILSLIPAPGAVGNFVPLANLAINVKDYGAVGDGIVDDTASIQTALTAALLARRGLYFPTGDYKLTGSTGTEFLLITKPIEVFGDGPTLSRLIVDSSVSTSKDIIRVSPPVTAGAVATWLINASRDNQGYSFHDFAVLSSNEQIVQTDPYPSQPARDAIVIDVSTANQYVYGLEIARLHLGSFSRYGINFNNSNGAGGARNQDGLWGIRIYGNTIRNGIFAQFWGDSVWLNANYFVGQNAAIESWQTSGATTLNIVGNNITNRGGLIFHNGLGINLESNIIEMYVVPSTGSNGAAVDFRGDSGEIQRVHINGNEINTHIVGSTMNGIRLDNVNTVQMDSNTFRGRAGFFGIVTTASAVNPIFGLNFIESVAGAGFTLISTADPFPVYKAYTINLEPSVSIPGTFIPNYFGVDKVYSKLVRVSGSTTPVSSLTGLGMDMFFESDAEVDAAGTYSASGGAGAATLVSINRDSSTLLDLNIAGRRATLNFTSGVFLPSLSASILLRLDSSKKIAPVTIGSGLSFDGTTLLATGGGSGDMILASVQTVTGAKTFDPGKLIIGAQSSPPSVVARSFWVDSDDSRLYFGKSDGSSWLEVFLAGLSGPMSVPNGGTGVATLTGIVKGNGTSAFSAATAGTDYVVPTVSVNAQTGTTYTIQASDNGQIVTLSNASAITVTVPSGLGAGFNCLLIQIGAGQVSLTASGVTINNRQSHLKLAGQHAGATLASYVANVFNFSGDTAA